MMKLNPKTYIVWFFAYEIIKHVRVSVLLAGGAVVICRTTTMRRGCGSRSAGSSSFGG